MADPAKKQRIIGIHHVLRKMKDAGLVEEESLYAAQAVSNVQDELEKKAATWYQIGARRGGLEVLKAILEGQLTVELGSDGTKEIVAHVNEIAWKKRLNISTGINKKSTPSKTYKLTTEDLEFE